MTKGSSHPAFEAAFCSDEQKVILCDVAGIILAVSDALVTHCQTIFQDMVGQPLVIESSKFNSNKPWQENLSSHYHETRINASVSIGDLGELHQLNIVTIQPLQLNNTLSGFKVFLEGESLFNQSLPSSAWQQLFNDSTQGMCLINESLSVLSANKSFCELTQFNLNTHKKIDEVVNVKDSFLRWFVDADVLASEADLILSTQGKKAFINITPVDLGGRQVFYCTLIDQDSLQTENIKQSESFKRFRSVFDDNLNGIAFATPEGIFTEVNNQFAKLLQYEPEYIIGKHFTHFNANNSHEMSEADAKTFVNTGFSRPFEKRLLRRNGEEFNVSVQLFPNFDSNGTFTGAWNFIRPLDDEHKIFIDRSRSLDKLFTESKDALLLTDLEGNVKMVNDAFADLLETQPDKLINKNINERTHLEDLEFEKNVHLPHLLERGFTDLFEKRYCLDNGELIALSVRSSILRNPVGKPDAIWTIARDAGIQRKLIQSLAVSERRFRSLFSSSFDAIGFWTTTNELQYANKAYLELVGYSQEELRNLTFNDFTPPGWEEADHEMGEQVAERGYSDIFEKEVLRKDGTVVPISIRASAMKDNDGSILGSWVIIRDISQYKSTLRKLQHSQNMLQQTSRMSRVGGWELNPDTMVFSLTDETFQILSIPRSYHTSVKNIAKLLDTESEKKIFTAINQVLKGRGSSTLELKLMGFSPERWVRVSAQLAFEEKDKRYVSGAIQDISDFKQQQKSLESARDTFQKMAFHDPLTNLPNRLLLEDRFQQISNQARRDRKMVALMIIDLDDFKGINDDHGHPAGDLVLLKIAKRLLRSIRSSDTVARLGGDEFVVIAMLEDEKQAQSLATKILRSIRKPVHWKAHDLSTSCSIGISMCSKHDESFESLYALADDALYHVKEHGKGNFGFSE